MAISKLFKSTFPTISYIGKGGQRCEFINGRFATDDAEIAQQLEKEVKSRHPHIYIDPDEKEIDSELQEMIESKRREGELEAIREYEAKVAARNGGVTTILNAPSNVVANPSQNANALQVAQNTSQSKDGVGILPVAQLVPAANLIQQEGMTPAQLLNVTTSATLGKLGVESNTGTAGTLGALNALAPAKLL